MDEFLKMAMEMVKAQAGVRPMTADEIAVMVQNLAKKFAGLTAGKESETQAEVAASTVDAKKSITEKNVICLECGKKMKLITSKHLASHGLTKKEYLAKHGLKKGTSLVAKGIARMRKEKMMSMELWKRCGVKGAEAVAEKKPTRAAKKAPAAKKE